MAEHGVGEKPCGCTYRTVDDKPLYWLYRCNEHRNTDGSMSFTYYDGPRGNDGFGE